MDFNALRAQTLGSGQDEEAVTVNTRALIDKVLARYSGEWTVLRELLQNAADAGARKVTVKFETIPSAIVPLPQDTSPSLLLKHLVQHHTLKRLVVTNNGQSFNENDWTRLKRIAEGNPDETKIGAFGVGFYSVFADCEEPFVSSGQEAMAFFWKSNALFTRRLKLQDKQASTDTNFVLDYRDTTSAVPPLLPLAQFLANSLTFVGIQNIELWLDEYKVLSLTKKTSPSQDVSIPRDIESKTSEGLMKIVSVTKEVAQIDGEWMPIIGWKQQRGNTNRINDRDSGPSLRKFFSRLAGAGLPENPSTTQLQRPLAEPQDLHSTVKATIFLNVDTANIKTFTGAKFNEELERATKKPPPKQTKLAVLTAPYIENDTNAVASVAGDVFATILPTKSGRIFIGFPTHQTTGLCAHISAPSVIPTVERESIDLNARYVRTWNMEMLRAAGIVCRIAWAAEMSNLKSKIVRLANGSKIRPDHVTPVISEAITTTKNFSFQESTPSAKTGQLLEDAFWTCSKKASIDVLSSCGVLPTHEVRIAPKDLSFVEGVPVLPEKLVAEAKSFVNKLVDFGLVTEVTVSDIKLALESTPLNTKQLSEFLDWITRQAGQGKLDRSSITNLLAVAVASDDQQENSGRLLILSSIKHFLNPSRIPEQMPTPTTVIPFKFTRTFSKHDLELLGWEELQIVPWMRWLLTEARNRDVLSEDQDLTQSPAFSAQIFPLLSKQWDALSQSSKTSLVELLSSKTVIPTKLGMKKPTDSYFPNVKLFDDLPTIIGIGNVKDKVLVAFGVRKTVELGVVFDRLLTPRGQPDGNAKITGSHVALIQYLASVRDDIPGADMQRLRNTPICPREDKTVDSKESEKRYKVVELYEPRPQLRDLGLPVLAWPGPYRSSSAEGRFLSGLGLRTVPQVPELLEIMARAGATGDIALRDRTLAFFISNYHANNYGNFDYSKVAVPFLPLENNNEELSTPSQCFVDEGALLLGFNLLKQDLQAHAPMFGVRRHPPIDQCINLLGNRPPTSYAQARALFTYFSSRLGEINNSTVPKLQDLNFVPIFAKNKEKNVVKDFSSPRNCFLGDSDTFSEIFNYVDFGPEANAFLLKCGSKPEPSKIEVAQLLVREPARISSTFRNPEKYMTLLRSLAESIAVLKKNKDLFREMKKAPFLLASKEIPQIQSVNGKMLAVDDPDNLDEEESQGIREWQLTSAENAIIIDDYINYSLFKADILAAPQEESLEDFYYALGSPMLSSLVEEAARHGPRSPDQRSAQRLQKQILERSTLFLHEQNPDTIKHDARWLEKNLTVQLVSSISLRRSLKGTTLSNTQKRTAVITQINREYTLWIAGERPDLYQVSQALVHVLLTRPKLHSALTLEMLLKTDLLELRARGFNVSRILRQKAAEARLAENKRQQALEEEQKRIEEQQKTWQSQESKNPQAIEQKGKLPGGFPESPDAKGIIANQPPRGTSVDEEDLVTSAQKWGSNLVRQLGFGRDRQPQPEQHNQVQSQQAHNPSQDLPPPYSQQSNGPRQPNQPGGSSVTAPHQLHENLLSAIRKTRPHNSSELFSRGETNTVSETKSYCDERPAHDLVFVAEVKHGIQMFLPSASESNTAFLSANSAGLTSFADILKVVGAEIFNLNPRTLNIFYEVGGKTIAFNRNGSIFCNYLYFKQLHEASLVVNASQVSRSADAEAEAVVYWWVILCHELAHNLVGDHSSDHSYYTEGFVAQYFGKVMRTLSKRNDNAAIPKPANLLE